MGYSRENILQHIEALSFPRRTGSLGNERARAYILGFFQRHALDVEIHEFSFSTFWISVMSRVLPIMIPGLIILSALVFETHPFLGFGAIMVIFVLLFIGTRWNHFSQRIAGCEGPRRSSNIIARIPAERSSQNVVFMAHYDSKSQTIPIKIRIPSLMIFMILSGAAILLLLIKGSGILAIEKEPIITMSVVSFIFVLPHLINSNRNGSPGAIDNASGIGIMLELALVLKEHHGPGMPSFTFVATGAEEEGLIGSVNFTKKYAEIFPRDTTFFINFDSAGAPGKIILISKYGIFARKRARKLSAALLKSASERNVHMVRGNLPPGTGVDSFPLSYSGFEAVTVSSGTLSKPVFSIHSPNDTSANISADTIEKIVSCVLAFACPEAFSHPGA